MDDRALGFALIGIGIVFVLGTVFIVTSRMGSRPAAEAAPPQGVHMPAPSLLPALMSLAALLIGAGLAFKADDELIANPWLAIPGVLLFIAGVVTWVRDAGHEWRDAEHGAHGLPGAHDDSQAH